MGLNLNQLQASLTICKIQAYGTDEYTGCIKKYTLGRLAGMWTFLVVDGECQHVCIAWVLVVCLTLNIFTKGTYIEVSHIDCLDDTACISLLRYTADDL